MSTMSKKKLTSAQIIASTFGEIDSDTDSDIDITSKKWTTKKSLAEVPKASSESNSSQKPDASAPNTFFFFFLIKFNHYSYANI